MAGIGYAFISAYLKGEEARTVTTEHLNALMKAPGYQDAVDAIRDTDIGNYLEGLDIQTFDELDEHLWKYFSDCLERIAWFTGTPDLVKQIVEIYKEKYDIQNIKTGLQNIITGTKAKGIPAGSIYSSGSLESLLNAETLDEIKSVLNAGKLSDYAAELEKYRAEDGFKNDIVTDTTLESLYYRKLVKAIKKGKDATTLLKVVYTIVDLINLQIILRAVISESGADASGKTITGGYNIPDTAVRELLTQKYQDIASKIENATLREITEEIVAGYERDKNVSVIDEAIDKHKFRIIRDMISPRIMSAAVPIWYLILKEIELRNVRLILKATLDAIPSEEIRNYLVFSS